MSSSWSGLFPIHSYELDPNLRLSMPAYLGFLQEAAGNNADALGCSLPQLHRRGLTWMLCRLRLRLLEHPGWRQSLTVETWPVGFERLFAVRDFRTFLDGREIGAAASGWLLLDLGKRRPVRPETLMDWTGVIRPERALAAELEKLPPFPAAGGEGLQERELTARYGDLDANRHVTNLRYAEWLLESLPARLLDSREMSGLDLDFLAEAAGGERILSRSLPAGDGGFEHSLVRLQDGVEVARARSRWRPAGPLA